MIHYKATRQIMQSPSLKKDGVGHRHTSHRALAFGADALP